MPGDLQAAPRTWAQRRDDLRRLRELSEVDRATYLRLARIEHESMAACAKVNGLTSAGRIGVVEFNALDMFANACAGGDHFRSDANRLLTETVRLSIAEIIAGLGDTYAHESARYSR